MSRASIEQRLHANRAELARAREELQVLEEQLLHFAEVAEHARIRSLVAETPQAVQEYKDAQRSADVFRKNRDEWAATVNKLERRQDELLDAFMDASDSD